MAGAGRTPWHHTTGSSWQASGGAILATPTQEPDCLIGRSSLLLHLFRIQRPEACFRSDLNTREQSSIMVGKPSVDMNSEQPLPNPARRQAIRQGLKLAFVAPVISTFYAREAYAASYSCYPAGHACEPPGQNPPELCCPGLSCVAVGQGGRCQ